VTEENLDPEGQPQDPAQEPEAAPEGTHGDPLAEAAEAVDVPDEALEGGEPAEPAEEEDELTATRRALDERTRDLQRLQAEYVNYKKRVDRDRELVRQNATYAALAPIIEVLDTIDRAREHGELEGGFKAVADQLERVVSNLGLTRFGEPGDAFDPNIHEALTHLGTDPEVCVTTCQHIAKSGYRIGDRVVRAAQVLVVDPADG
jgi:molecular chaperone GrpE